LTFLFDALKGWIPAWVFPFAVQAWQGSAAPALGLVCGVAAVAGHNWPVYLRFKGGKGVATSAGVLLGLAPAAMAVGLVVWAVLFLATQYVSLASVGAAVAVAAAGWLLYGQADRPLTGALVLLAASAIARHRGNIRRLWVGQERRMPLPWRRQDSSSRTGSPS
jgi:glycerol-3-phosphate acyltransferase PlsY